MKQPAQAIGKKPAEEHLAGIEDAKQSGRRAVTLSCLKSPISCLESLITRRFVEGIGKLVGNAKGDHRKQDQRTCRKIARGCRSMREYSWILAPVLKPIWGL
ncbi:hypothetical protein BHM03_00039944 [Ensete ventricosum]|nr:hypothetical protein BHM03_00039944 [Ensete ventricosum]